MPAALIALIPMLIATAEKLFPSKKIDGLMVSQGPAKKDWVMRILDLAWDFGVDKLPDDIEGAVDSVKAEMLAKLDALVEQMLEKWKSKA